MKKNLKNVALALLLFINSVAFAQMAAPANIHVDDIASIKINNSKKLVVITIDKNEEFAQKLEKKNQLEKLKVYNSIIETYNSSIKQYVDKYITNFPKIEYVTAAQFSQFKKDQLKNIYTLKYSVSDDIGSVPGSEDGDGWVKVPLEKTELDSNEVFSYSRIELLEYDAKGKENELFIEVAFYNLIFTKGELEYAISQLGKKCTNQSNVSDKDKEISSKTLIINESNLDKGITESDIKKVYPYNFKIVSNTEFKNQLLNQDGSILCLMVFPVMKMSVGGGNAIKLSKMTVAYCHVMYNPKNHDSYIVTQPKGLVGYSMVNQKITIKNFKSFTKN